MEDSLVFTTAISRIWLVGLVLFALTPFLIAARPQPQDTQVENIQPTIEPTGKTEADTRTPSSETAQAPLATGN